MNLGVEKDLKFFDIPFFYIDDNGWDLKDGAPKETVEEFNKYANNGSQNCN